MDTELGRENVLGRMGVYMKETGRRIIDMDWESFIDLMGMCIRVAGMEINNMVLEKKEMNMVMSLKQYGLKVLNKVKVLIKISTINCKISNLNNIN